MVGQSRPTISQRDAMHLQYLWHDRLVIVVDSILCFHILFGAQLTKIREALAPARGQMKKTYQNICFLILRYFWVVKVQVPQLFSLPGKNMRLPWEIPPENNHLHKKNHSHHTLRGLVYRREATLAQKRKIKQIVPGVGLQHETWSLPLKVEATVANA